MCAQFPAKIPKSTLRCAQVDQPHILPVEPVFFFIMNHSINQEVPPLTSSSRGARTAPCFHCAALHTSVTAVFLCLQTPSYFGKRITTVSDIPPTRGSHLEMKVCAQNFVFSFVSCWSWAALWFRLIIRVINVMVVWELPLALFSDVTQSDMCRWWRRVGWGNWRCCSDYTKTIRRVKLHLVHSVSSVPYCNVITDFCSGWWWFQRLVSIQSSTFCCTLKVGMWW